MSQAILKSFRRRRILYYMSVARRAFREGVALRWHVVLLFLYTFLVAFGFQEGFEFGQVAAFRDQSVQLPILYSYANPNLFHGDILLDARDSYITWLYPVLGILSRTIPLYSLMLGIYVLSVGMTLAGIYYLAVTLFQNGHHAGIIAMILWTAWFPNPGGDFLLSPFPTHTTFAIGLQLFGMCFALRKRYFFGALFIGLAFNINAMTSLTFAICWAFGLLGDRKQWSWRLWQIPVIMFVMALPVLIWRFQAGVSEGDAAQIDEFVRIMRIRLWYAIFPFSVNHVLWLLFAVVMGVWVYTARYVSRETNRQVFWMMQGITLLVFIGTFFTEIVPVESVIQLQLLRSTWVLILFAKLYIAHMLVIWLRGSARDVRLALGAAVLLAIPRIVMEIFPLQQPVPYEAYMDFQPFRQLYGVNILEGIAVIAAVVGIGITLRRMMQLRVVQENRRLVLWFFVAGILFTVPFFINTAVPSKQGLLAENWHATQEWVRRNTPQDARFITPPTMDGFRVYAERTSFGDWKDGTLLVFDKELASEWLTRMELLGFDADSFSFHAVTFENLCAIATQYNMDYVVALQTWEVDGEAVYQNDDFVIYPVNQLRCSVEMVSISNP